MLKFAKWINITISAPSGVEPYSTKSPFWLPPCTCLHEFWSCLIDLLFLFLLGFSLSAIRTSDHLLLILSTIEVYSAWMKLHAYSIPLPLSFHIMMTQISHSQRKIRKFSSICLKCSCTHDFYDIYFSENFRDSVFVLVRYILYYPLPVHYIKEEKFLNRITFTWHCLDVFF